MSCTANGNHDDLEKGGFFLPDAPHNRSCALVLLTSLAGTALLGGALTIIARVA
jgi:hypothetical protein